jgi:hypothetical protein
MEAINKYKSQIIFAGSAIISVCVLIFYIIPQVQSIYEEVSRLDTENKKNEILAKKVDFLGQLETTEIEEKYRLTTQALLKDKNPYKIFGLIDNALSKITAQDINLGMIQFMPGEMKGGKTNKTSNLMFDVPVTGKYDAFLELVKQIESSYPLVSVMGVSGKISDAAADLKVSFTMYIAPEPEYIPSLETPLVDFTAQEISFFDNISLFAPEVPEAPAAPQKFNNTNLF